MFRSKDQQEVQELEKEGAKAISVQPDEPIKFSDENYVMVVGEERTVLKPHALEDPHVRELISTLLRWINDVLEGSRIIVRHIVDDLYDGQVLGELLATLTKEDLNVVGVTQSSYMQKNKLKYLLEKVDELLGITHPSQRKWSLTRIHSKDVVAILHLMVALARFFRCQLPLPRNVTIKMIHVKQLENRMETDLFEEVITGDDIGPIAPAPVGAEKDVFDKLFEEAPEKLQAVKRSLCQFSSRVLQELDIFIGDIESQFGTGVYLILMLGLLEGYFVPLYQFHYNPVGFDEKLDNMKLVFRLLEDCGLPQKRTKPEDLVHMDLKSTLRVLYAIFGKYKSTFQQQHPTTPTTPTTPQAPSGASAV